MEKLDKFYITEASDPHQKVNVGKTNNSTYCCRMLETIIHRRHEKSSHGHTEKIEWILNLGIKI